MVYAEFLVFILFLASVTSEDTLLDIGDVHRRSNLEFTKAVFKIFSGMYEEDEDILFSPLAVQSSLSLTLLGAAEYSAAEITTGAYLPTDLNQLQLLHEYIVANLKNSTKFLNVANRIYFIEDLKPKDRFIDRAKAFNADIKQIENYSQVSEEVHEWILNQGTGNIKLTKNRVDLVIATTVYFKGEWAISFQTDYDLYHIPDEGDARVEMLAITGNFYYLEDDDLDCKFIELPFVGDEVTLTIALPKDTNGFQKLEKRISEVLDKNCTSKTFVHVRIPKFFGKKSTIHYQKILQSIGVMVSFVSAKSFDKFSNVNLYINDIVEQTSIEVKENGAYVASGVINVHRRTRSQAEFIAGHPFLYYYRHKILGILFIGRTFYPH